MVGFGEALKEGVRGALCVWADTQDNMRGWFNENSAFPLPQDPWVGAIQSSLCNTPPIPSGSGIPFTGGQCPTLYTIRRFARYNLYNCSDDTLSGSIDQELPAIGGKPGPIKYLGAHNVAYESCDDGKLSTQQFGVEAADGTIFSVGPAQQQLVGKYIKENTSYFEVVREDGQPDDCGNPPPGSNPPDTPDGGWRLPDIDITYDPPSGPQIQLNLPAVVFPPVIAAGGVIFAPVRIEAPDLNIELNAEINLNGDFNISFGNRQPPGTDTTVDAPPPGQPPEIAAPDPDADDTERRVIGVIVTVTAINSGAETVIFQDGGNPDLLLPDVGVVSFAVSGGVEGFGWTEDQRVKNSKTYIPCPAPQGALSVKGTPRYGVQWELTPVYGARARAFTQPR